MIYGIYGTGGMAREAMEYYPNSVFIDDFTDEKHINSKPVMRLADFLMLSGERNINVAVGNSKIRQEILTKCIAEGCRPFSIIGAFCSRSPTSRYGNACILGNHASITANTTIGDGMILNCGARIAHDCLIGNWVTISPGALINGNVEIGDHVFIGSGAAIRNGGNDKRLKIGDGAFIAMGAIVTQDVPAGAKVYGPRTEVRLPIGYTNVNVEHILGYM